MRSMYNLLYNNQFILKTQTEQPSSFAPSKLHTCSSNRPRSIPALMDVSKLALLHFANINCYSWDTVKKTRCVAASIILLTCHICKLIDHSLSFVSIPPTAFPIFLSPFQPLLLPPRSICDDPGQWRTAVGCRALPTENGLFIIAHSPVQPTAMALLQIES